MPDMGRDCAQGSPGESRHKRAGDWAGGTSKPTASWDIDSQGPRVYGETPGN